MKAEEATSEKTWRSKARRWVWSWWIFSVSLLVSVTALVLALSTGKHDWDCALSQAVLSFRAWTELKNRLYTIIYPVTCEITQSQSLSYTCTILMLQIYQRDNLLVASQLLCKIINWVTPVWEVKDLLKKRHKHLGWQWFNTQLDNDGIAGHHQSILFKQVKNRVFHNRQCMLGLFLDVIPRSR